MSKKNELDNVAADTGQRKLAGVEMEGYAVLRAQKLHRDQEISSIVIKSVMDLASDKNDVHKKYAAFNAGAFLFHFLVNSDLVNELIFDEY